MIDIDPFFDDEEKEIFAQMESLHKALTHLRYEGKLLRHENIQAVQILAFSVDMAVEKHRQMQEEIIFPFLGIHIPRHEAVIFILKTQHDDIVRSVDKLKKEVLKISKEPDESAVIKVYETGIYVVTLLRHHAFFEKKNLSCSFQEELHKDERNAISRRVGAWLKENNYQSKTG